MRRYGKVSGLVLCMALTGVLLGGTQALASRSRGVSRTCLASEDPCRGTSRGDQLTASDAAPGVVVDVLGGNDIVNGKGVGSVLVGGRGKDIINGGGGDEINSQDGRRPSNSRSVADIVNCKPGDVLVAFDPSDQLNGCS